MQIARLGTDESYVQIEIAYGTVKITHARGYIYLTVEQAEVVADQILEYKGTDFACLEFEHYPHNMRVVVTATDTPQAVAEQILAAVDALYDAAG